MKNNITITNVININYNIIGWIGRAKRRGDGISVKDGGARPGDRQEHNVPVLVCHWLLHDSRRCCISYQKVSINYREAFVGK